MKRSRSPQSSTCGRRSPGAGWAWPACTGRPAAARPAPNIWMLLSPSSERSAPPSGLSAQRPRSAILAEEGVQVGRDGSGPLDPESHHLLGSPQALSRSVTNPLGPSKTFLQGSEHPPSLNPGGCGVESTAHNCRRQLKKRVADCKHGFESRWGRDGDFGVISPWNLVTWAEGRESSFYSPSSSRVSEARSPTVAAPRGTGRCPVAPVRPRSKAGSRARGQRCHPARKPR